MTAESRRMIRLWRATAQIGQEIEDWILEHDGKVARLEVQLKPESLAMLLRLRVWSVRYQIPVYEILDMMLPGLRELVDQTTKRNVLGVPVYVLTNDKAEGMVHDHVKRRYPQGENRIVWREHEQERQLDREQRELLDGLKPRQATAKGMLEYDTPEEFTEEYRRIMIERREKREAERSKEWRKRKPYRGNPWR
jgi:hypothetical protein